MAGTIEGGRKAALANKTRYGADFYRKIGAKGGRNGSTGGFAARIECNCSEFPVTHLLQQCAGRKGGRISRRPAKEEVHAGRY